MPRFAAVAVLAGALVSCSTRHACSAACRLHIASTCVSSTSLCGSHTGAFISCVQPASFTLAVAACTCRQGIASRAWRYALLLWLRSLVSVAVAVRRQQIALVVLWSRACSQPAALLRSRCVCSRSLSRVSHMQSRCAGRGSLSRAWRYALLLWLRLARALGSCVRPASSLLARFAGSRSLSRSRVRVTLRLAAVASLAHALGPVLAASQQHVCSLSLQAADRSRVRDALARRCGVVARASVSCL
jgi:hypothetical protein